MKNRIVWLFLLLVVIIAFSTTIGTFEPFVVAPRAKAAYRSNNESFVVAPRAKAAYRSNNESFVVAPRAKAAYRANN